MSYAAPPPRKTGLGILKWVGAAVALGLLYLAFRDVDWDELLAVLKRARLEILIGAGGLLAVTITLRSIRWRLFMGTGRELGFWSVLWATTAGYLGNAYLPARAGDVLRAVLLARHLNMTKGYLLGTTVADRVLDAVVLLVAAGLMLPAVVNVPGWLNGAAIGLAVVAFAALVLVWLMPRFDALLALLVDILPLGHDLRDRLQDLLRTFMTGVRGLRMPEGAIAFLLLSAIAWAGDTVMVYLVGYALDVPLTFEAAALLVIALALSSAAPSTPGYIGVYQFVAVTVLVPLGLVRSEALGLILIFQAVLYAVVTLTGIVGLIALRRPDDPLR